MERTHPQVSVIIPVYNREKYVAQSIDSVLAQTFQDIELLVVNDGSTDRSSEILKHYAGQYPQKIRYFEHPNRRNCGVSASRNLGLRHAFGDYIAFLDSDDVWFPEKLASQMAVFETFQEVGWVYCALTVLEEHRVGSEETSLVDRVLGEGVPDAVFHAFDLIFSRAISLRSGSTLLFKKSLLQKIDRFDPDLLYGEDEIFAGKIAYFWPGFFISRPLGQYRLHAANASSYGIRGQGGKTINYTVMSRLLDWLQKISEEYATHTLRIRLAQLAHESYHKECISRWGLYRLLLKLFPYRSANLHVLKIFLTLFWGYRITRFMQKFLNDLKY
jgi:glycosyltransferase involved in cell wall biosynthesis